MRHASTSLSSAIDYFAQTICLCNPKTGQRDHLKYVQAKNSHLREHQLSNSQTIVDTSVTCNWILPTRDFSPPLASAELRRNNVSPLMYTSDSFAKIPPDATGEGASC